MNRLTGLNINLSPSPDQVANWLTSGCPLACDVETPMGQNDVIEMCGLARSAREGIVFEWIEPYISLMRRWL
jgi:hypothetical protein